MKKHGPFASVVFLIITSLGGKVSCARSASWDLWFLMRESLSRGWFRCLRKCLRVFLRLFALFVRHAGCKAVNIRIITETSAEDRRQCV